MDKTDEHYWISARARKEEGDWVTIGISETGEIKLWNFLVYGGGGEVSASTVVRPILTLKSTIEIVTGDGQSVDTAYTFE